MYLLKLLLPIITLTSFAQAKSNLLFEGYYKILAGKQHAGYIIQRYEFDPKKKVFTSTSFTKTIPAMGNINEGIKVTATQSLTPLKIQYTMMDKTKQKLIEGKVVKGIYKATVSDGKKVINRIHKKIKKSTFFSSFLPYLMLQSGIKTDTKYKYRAIAEETGMPADGQAYVGKEMVPYKGHRVFHVLNTFMGSRFISYMAATGEVYHTRSPANQISTELMPEGKLAIGNVGVPTDTIKILFGNIPPGTKHNFKPIAATPGGNTKDSPRQLNPRKQLPRPENPKGYYPGGKGVIIKGTPQQGKTGK